MHRKIETGRWINRKALSLYYPEKKQDPNKRRLGRLPIINSYFAKTGEKLRLFLDYVLAALAKLNRYCLEISVTMKTSPTRTLETFLTLTSLGVISDSHVSAMEK